MEVHNNFSPLAFRKKESKATYEKWYAFGKNYAIPASANTLTPFQFTELTIPVFDPNTIEVEVINEETGEAKKSGVYVSFDVMPEHGGVLYVSPGKNSFREALPQGTYRARFSIGDEVYISTPFCVIPGIETSSKYLLIEYWNDEKIAYPDGFITTGANNDFRYQMYVPATICKPKYEFEEELTKRAGYKFLELQTSTKVYAFTFVAPEFICDAMRLIRLSDYIRISHDGEYYNALNFEFDVDWQEQLYLAAVDCQFETDSIIQKLPSFNRRDKASFYNALLANIDTPIMFSPDTVGLYYKEYRETEPVIKGKLIRELSPIDLIDKNTTIAVDLGTGEARKFNLFRMMEDYISKAHEDATDFLLHLRGGATFGDDITGGAAHINSVGDAKVNMLEAGDTSATTVDIQDWLSVNNIAFTVNKQGNTTMGELNARGNAHLEQNVYTGGGTGTITKEGQLQYLSAVIQEFITSPTFVPGFLGEGFKIWVENGNWHIECDNLTVRQSMNVFEIIISKIRSVNGALVVSQSNGKVGKVEEVNGGTQYKISFDDEYPTFQEHDLVRCQTFGKPVTQDVYPTDFTKWENSLTDTEVQSDALIFQPSVTGTISLHAVGSSQPLITFPEMTLDVIGMPEDGSANLQIAYATGGSFNSEVITTNGLHTLPEKQCDNVVIFSPKNVTDKVSVFLKHKKVTRPSGTFYWVEVAAIENTSIIVNKSEFNGVVPKVGDECVQMGNTQNPERQALIYITAQESGQPYIEILKGVNSKTLAGTNRTRLGDLNNIQDSAFPVDYQPHGSGLYSDNVWLKGIFLLRNNQTIEDYVKEKDDALKDYLDTEITAIPGKIELAVRSLKVADTNILKGAYTELNTLAYSIGYYRYDSNVITGKKYILTLCYTLGEGVENITPFSKNGSGALTPFNTKGNRVIESKEVVITEFDKNYKFEFFQFPNGIYGSKVHWAVLTDGNLGVTSWIPSTSEKNVGLKNLCSFKRIVDSGFTYASDYKDDGTFYVSPDKLHKQTNLANKDMFGLTYDPQKQYYIFVDSAIRTDGNLQESSIFFIIKYTDGTEQRICIVFPDRIEYNHIITNKPISRIVGSYGRGYVSNLRVGVYETNFPVSWSPAPEDQLYQSVKYTDTQILAVDGKIELSVKTQLEKTTIGGNNLIDGSKGYWFDESDYRGNVSLNYNPASNGWMSVLGSGAFNCYKRWMNVDKTVITPGKQYTLGIDVSIGGNYVHETGLFFNIRYHEGSTDKLIADKTIDLPNEAKWTRYYITLEIPSVLPSGVTLNDLMFLCGFTGNNTGTGAGLIVSYKNINLVEGGIGTSWSPSANDTYGKSVEYTTSQIDIVEKKIELKVSSTTYENGIKRSESIAKMLSNSKMIDAHTDVNFSNGTNNLQVYDNSSSGQIVLDVIDNDDAPNSTHKVLRVRSAGTATSPGAGGFYYGVRTDKNQILIFRFTAKVPADKFLSFTTNVAGEGYTSEWLTSNHGTGKWEEYIHVIYCGSRGTFSSTGFFYINQGGAYEMLISYASAFLYNGDNAFVGKKTYETKITQLDQSISLKASQTDLSATTERVRQAEIKLESTSIKLGVVEGTANGAQSTANAANSLAGTANNKAEAATERIRQAEIKLQPNNIALTVREQGIGYGGTNYFGWGAGISKDIVGAGVYVTENRGTYGLTIACANTTATILLRYSQLGMNFKGPGKYTLSFKARQQAGVAMDLNVNVCDAENFIITPPTTWQYYKKTFTVTNYTDSPYYGFIDFERSGGTTTQVIEFAEIMLEYGSEATQWRPAPFDTTAASGLLATGINISNGQIVLTADKTKFQNNSGTQIAVFDSNGINADLINAKKLSTSVAGKRIVVDPETQEVQLYNENGNKVAAIGFKQDGRISIPYIQLKDYSYTGSVLRAFDIYGGTLYSNETRYSANYGYTLSPTTGLQFTKNGSVTKSYPAQ